MQYFSLSRREQIGRSRQKEPEEPVSLKRMASRAHCIRSSRSRPDAERKETPEGPAAARAAHPTTEVGARDEQLEHPARPGAASLREKRPC